MKKTKTEFVRRWVSVLACLSTLSVASVASAERPRFFDLEGFGTWLDGNPESTVITEDGTIILGSLSRERYADAAATFSAATVWGEDVVVARVDDGQILRIDRAGRAQELYKVEERLVTAMVASKSALYVAVGPPAKIYRVTPKGKATVLHSPDVEFIWDMVLGPKDSLYAAAGGPAHVLEIDAKGNGKTLHETEETHLRSIAYDKNLGLFVGGGERGIVYRARDKKDALRAIYDSGHTEITSLAIQDNHILAAAVTGADALVSEQGNEQHGGGKRKGKGAEVNSQLVRVDMHGTAEVMAGSSDEAIFDLAIDDRGLVVVATGATGRDDPRGRLYTIDPDRRMIAMMYQSPSRRITHLLNLPRGAMAAVAAAGGRVTHLAGGLAKKGEFFTKPFDAVINSSYGILQIFGQWPKGTQVTGAVRSGQTAIPDETWSDWSSEIKAPGNQHPRVQNGRYAQVRLTLHSDGKNSPTVHRVRMAFLRHNLRPFVREVVALRKGVTLLPIIREDPKSKTINLGDNAGAASRAGDSTGKSSAPRARQVQQRGALTVKWVADDPNGDLLRYDLMIRSQGESDWRTVEEELVAPFYTLQSSQLPDGHYQFRIRATDAPSNPVGMEQSDTRESRSVLIDNTPPTFDPLDVRIQGRRVTVRTVVADAVGPLVDASFSVDGDRFRPLAPDDGVLDGPGENFTIRLGVMEPGVHTITVRTVDEGENEGFGEAQFTVR